MKVADIAIAALVLFFILFPKSSYRVDPYDKWDPARQQLAFDLEESLAKDPHDARAAVALADLYTDAVDHPEWALAALGPVRDQTSDWRVQVTLASAHAQRFEWPEAIAAAKAARDACALPGCSDDMSVRLDLYEQGLEAAGKSGATKPSPELNKAAEHARPQVWYPQAVQ